MKMTHDTTQTTKVAPRAARAWFLDYQPDDHFHAPLVAVWGKKEGDGRTVVARSASEIRFGDVVGGQKMSWVVHPKGEDTINISGSGQGWSSHGTLRFEPAPGGGSRLVSHTEMQVGAMGWFFMTLMGFSKKLNADLAGHVQVMEGDWAKKPW